MDFSANYIMWQDIKLLLLLLIVPKNLMAGCKESHFYSLPFGQAEANIY